MPRLRLAVCLAIAVAATGYCLPARLSAQSSVQTQTFDPFGQELTLTAKTIVFMEGTASWDTAYPTLVDTFKAIYDHLDKAGVKPLGPGMTIYTSEDDTGFRFQAAVPIAEAPRTLARGDFAVGKSPEGAVLKFVHRGSYASMDTTYDAILNLLDEKRLEAKDTYIEEYVTDLTRTPDEKLVINIFVPLK